MNFKKFISCAVATAVTMSLSLSAVAQQGVINTVVGGGPSNMPAIKSNLSSPGAVVFDAQGNYYVAVTSSNQVLKVSPSGTETLLAGNGIAGFRGDGGPAVLAELNSPYGVAVDGANPANVYIADFSNCTIRVVNQGTGFITSLNLPQTCTGGDGGPANLAGFYPLAIALNPLNNDLYVVDYYYNGGSIRTIQGGVSTGTVTTVAGGSASVGYCGGTAPFGDGGSATGANVVFCFNFNGISSGIALDTSVTPPNILIADGGHCAVREVIGGKIFRVAGSYSLGCGFKDAAIATSAQFYDPSQLQVQVSGTTQIVTIADTYNMAIRRFTVTATVPTSGNILTAGPTSTVAGMPTSGGGMGGDGGAATSALLYYPQGIAFDSAGNLFIADTDNERVRKVDTTPTHIINTVAGYSLVPNTAGQTAFDNPVGNDGVPGTGKALDNPLGVFVNPTTNNVFIAAPPENVVHEFLSSSSAVNTVAGNGTAGYVGDANAANDPGTELSGASGVAQDSNGNTYIADPNNQVVRMVSYPSGTISTFAGGSNDVAVGCGNPPGDGGLPTAAALCTPSGVAVDANSNVYIADSTAHVVREVSASTGFISTIAGATQTAGYGGDGGSATNALLNGPTGVAVDGAGNIYIADKGNNRIRRIDANNIITTVAGNGYGYYSGDGLATQNNIDAPQAVAADANGNFFFADTSNNILRWVDPAGTMLTFAGDHNNPGFAGDGGAATSASLYNPAGISVDGSGNIFFADEYNNRIRKVNAFAAVGRSTGSVNFPVQNVGTTSGAFDVTLSGIGPASISNVTTSRDFSELDDCIGSLPNGTNCTVSVYFTPTKTGKRYGTLTVTSNGFLNTTSTVALQGFAVGLTITGSPLAIGNVQLGSSATKSVTIKGATTYNSVYLSGDTTDFVITSNTCTGSVSVSCSISVTFTPHATGAKKATLVIKDSDPTSPQLVAVTGTGTSYESFTPSSVAFKTQLVNTNSTATKVTFKYVNGTNTITLNSLTASANFSLNTTGITTGACSLTGTTTVGSSGCAFNVVFAPGSTPSAYAGTVTASFTGDPSGNSSAQLPLTGTATEVSLAPAAMAFGKVLTGNTKSLSVTVTNKGTTPLTFNGTPTITGTGSSNFAVLPYSASPSYSTCLNGTVTLAQNASCTFTVQFTSPSGTGNSFTDYLNINDNGGASPQLEKMTASN